MSDQPSLDFSAADDRPVVDIEWCWSDSGWYGNCPLCIKGTIGTIKTAETECIHCKAKFKLVPGGPQRKDHETLGPWFYQAWVTDPGKGPDDVFTKLSVTLYVISKGPGPLSKAQKDAILHRLIKDYDGYQDHAMGTVIFHIYGPPLPKQEDDPTVQLWLHEWE